MSGKASPRKSKDRIAGWLPSVCFRQKEGPRAQSLQAELYAQV
jgi:hypothetical protein